MADGLNDARALRVAEIMNDFRTLQFHISQQKTTPPSEDQNKEGYALMRQCSTEAQALLVSQYNPGPSQNAGDDGEKEKVQLQRIILDASARRFQAHKIYLRAAATKRWVMNREKVLQGRKSSAAPADMKTIDDSLRNEISTITDNHVVSELRAADVRAGHWIEEDPSLSTMLSFIRSQ
ncbi:hypothetical protein FQN54_007196 [Arachnomyces sp. PD_36]|nr:hypothetical protein FQN54_007196 [Arachnomyces sp. PD_36]